MKVNNIPNDYYFKLDDFLFTTCEIRMKHSIQIFLTFQFIIFAALFVVAAAAYDAKTNSEQASSEIASSEVADSAPEKHVSLI